MKKLPHFWARYPQNYPQYFAVHQSFFLKLSPIFLQDHYFVLVRYKYKTPAKAGIIYLFITSKKKTSLSRFFGPAFIMYVEWDSGDYSAKPIRYLRIARLLRINAENRRFWQRSRIAYNAPVFAGLIDCTGPVLLLVAVAGQMCPAGTFTRSANPPNFPFYEIRSINFGISEAAPITAPNSSCGISAACQFDRVSISDFPTLAKGDLQSPFSSRIFY